MLNKYPLWKNFLILFVFTFGIIYAFPNLYPDDAAIQIAAKRDAAVGQQSVEVAAAALQKAGIEYFGEEVQKDSLLIRVKNKDQQIAAKEAVQKALGNEYIVALNLAPTTPDWLLSLGAQPMKLGLDLSGGVHFLIEVDVDGYVNKRLKDNYIGEFKQLLKDKKVRYKGIIYNNRKIIAQFKTVEARDEARQILRGAYSEFIFEETEGTHEFGIIFTLSEAKIKESEAFALEQNITSLRKRVNELGVSEPLVQKQGRNRIVVELPGIQDTAGAKNILGKTATLEFRLEARLDAPRSRTETFEFLSGNRPPAKLAKKRIISGDSVIDAQIGYDGNSGQPQTSINLDDKGGKAMLRATKKNVSRGLGVLFIETTPVFIETEQMVDGKKVTTRSIKYEKSSKLISLANINEPFGARFRVTGLSSKEASELALLLRAGALAADMAIVEERTIGPSLGAENIAVGVLSVEIGLAAVLVCMIVFYRVFGLLANIALAVNLILLVAVMSVFGATLTLPGIAGIVLTVGMAVDANVLIFSRIKEEFKNGLSPQAAINSGFEHAFVTILDANITTLLVAVILYGVGTGPVKGFAITLSIGILTSMFTAIMGTRALVNTAYGGRKMTKLGM